jgi:hypothetical protein
MTRLRTCILAAAAAICGVLVVSAALATDATANPCVNRVCK